MGYEWRFDWPKGSKECMRHVTCPRDIIHHWWLHDRHPRWMPNAIPATPYPYQLRSTSTRVSLGRRESVGSCGHLLQWCTILPLPWRQWGMLLPCLVVLWKCSAPNVGCHWLFNRYQRFSAHFTGILQWIVQLLALCPNSKLLRNKSITSITPYSLSVFWLYVTPFIIFFI